MGRVEEVGLERKIIREVWDVWSLKYYEWKIWKDKIVIYGYL